jgi:hypothetical protein
VTTSTLTFTVLSASRTVTTGASAQHDRVGAGVEGTVAKRLDLGFEAVGHIRDLGRRQRRDPKRTSELLEASPPDPEHVAGGDHASEGYLESDDGALRASRGR